MPSSQETRPKQRDARISTKLLNATFSALQVAVVVPGRRSVEPPRENQWQIGPHPHHHHLQLQFQPQDLHRRSTACSRGWVQRHHRRGCGAKKNARQGARIKAGVGDVEYMDGRGVNTGVLKLVVEDLPSRRPLLLLPPPPCSSFFLLQTPKPSIPIYI
ncbi:hypothetical protein FF1_045951 [Malus domestica]